METLHRDFGTTPAMPQRAISFTVAGEKFEAVGRLSGMTFMKFTRSLRAVNLDKIDPIVMTDLVLDFFRVAVKDWPRFESHVESPDTAVDITELIDIFMWLMEAYAGRPFSTPSPSAAGQTESTDGSTDDSSSPDETISPTATPIAG